VASGKSPALAVMFSEALFSRPLVSAALATSLAWLLGCSSAPVPPLPNADAGTGIDARCGEPAPPIYDDAPSGWASVPDLGVNGTTGGEGGEVVAISTTADFVAANERSEPLVIEVSGTIGDGLRLKVGSNKTIRGVGERPTIQGSLDFDGVVNVIARNLYVVGNNCSDGDTPGNCEGGSDAVRISDGSHHVWIDHFDVSDGSDGNLDINDQSDYITISWTKFSYSNTARTHRYSNLIGSGDGNVADRGKLRVTWHHVWWADNVQERMPRSRYGDVHVFNSYYSSRRNSYCVRAGVETRILTEGNYFERVEEPFDIENETGVIESKNNVFDGTEPIATGTAFVPPYTYTPDDPQTVPCSVGQGAGPH
jgi:pectate lyase